MTVTILIPAAGASSRMRGTDKLLEPVDGVPLLRRTVDRALPHGDVLVTLPALDHPRTVVLPRAARIVVVPGWKDGLSGSLRAGADAATGDLMILPADMPDITGEDIATVIAARGTQPDALIWQGATGDGTAGHPVLFHVSLLHRFDELSGDAGARALVAQHQDRRILVPLPGHHARTDLDTPEDWARWRKTRP